MKHPTVQDIFLKFYPKYLEKYSPSPHQSKVATCIINCKTGAYGANVQFCEDCGHPQIHYKIWKHPRYLKHSMVSRLLFVNAVADILANLI